VAFRTVATAPLLHLRARQGIFQPGDPADVVFEIVEGAVLVEAALGDGRRQIIEIARTGALIGFAAGAVQTLSAETLAPTLVRPITRA
ncbi:cyclic nucleotide-binding domain-containing protein, partial [Mycobacterium tuberculosis]|nr:cyclic nucleotide-binding domain-containing protein [Mycobacterium tuberculosis]MBP0651114.1 cyclic nucleotide-binding domain-containing protein [Mycobacterium tuberculosis]